MKEITISKFDVESLGLIRQNVYDFLSRCAARYDKAGLDLLDIAPQVWEGASPHFRLCNVHTLDIDEKSNCDYIADICQRNDDKIPESKFDIVVCTEVLEHVLNPFDAVKEICRILKPEGIAIVTTPFNFRIHGPAPDCWRFTEMGLRTLFSKNFEIIDIESMNTNDRPLMPIQYTLIAKNVK